MKDLHTFGVKEMSTQEIKEVSGGIWWKLISLTIAMFNDAVNNPDDLEAGVNATYNPNAGSNFI